MSRRLTPHYGTLPPATERDDAAYLEFAEGLRAFTSSQLAPVMNERAGKVLVETRPSTIGEVRDALDRIPIVAARNRFMRSTQEMKWVGILDTYGKREDELLADLDAADTKGPGTLSYDPNMPMPEYMNGTRIHLQPGGYLESPLSGYHYHYGTKVFFTGKNNDDDMHRGQVAQVPAPADGQVRRILDLGCSAGQSATAFKERFPQAEVWGIDSSVGMVRYSHKRAVEMGLDVNFKQALAEAPGFPDNHFDIVHAFILFHELPVKVGEQVIAEAHRMLRPGGVLAIMDFGSRDRGVSVADYTRDFDTRDNGEQFASDFVYSDFHGTIRRIFGNLNPNAAQTSVPMRVAIK